MARVTYEEVVAAQGVGALAALHVPDLGRGVRRSGQEARAIGRIVRERPDTFVVTLEGAAAFDGGRIPDFDSVVVRARGKLFLARRMHA